MNVGQKPVLKKYLVPGVVNFSSSCLNFTIFFLEMGALPYMNLMTGVFSLGITLYVIHKYKKDNYSYTTKQFMSL